MDQYTKYSAGGGAGWGRVGAPTGKRTSKIHSTAAVTVQGAYGPGVPVSVAEGLFPWKCHTHIHIHALTLGMVLLYRQQHIVETSQPPGRLERRAGLASDLSLRRLAQ